MDFRFRSKEKPAGTLEGNHSCGCTLAVHIVMIFVLSVLRANLAIYPIGRSHSRSMEEKSELIGIHGTLRACRTWHSSK